MQVSLGHAHTREHTHAHAHTHTCAHTRTHAHHMFFNVLYISCTRHFKELLERTIPPKKRTLIAGTQFAYLWQLRSWTTSPIVSEICLLS